MDIFIYSDESGTFDCKHFDHFVYGGVAFISKDDKDSTARKYKSIEKDIRKKENFGDNEIKASKIKAKVKRRLFECSKTNGCYPFGVVINLKNIKQKNNIFSNSKSKQRYMDYTYKIGIKAVLLKMIGKGLINKEEGHSLHFYVDEHQSATDGRYELKEALEQEFNTGTYNYNYEKYFEPVFANRNCAIDFNFRDSKRTTLVRLSDIVANYIWHKVNEGKDSEWANKFFALTILP